MFCEFTDNSLPNLWRANRVKDNGSLFGLVEKDKRLSNGQVRNRPRGISTFDWPNTFKGHWEYYKLPGGSSLPKGLVIMKDSYNPIFKTTHHTIAPEMDMSLIRFKLLLNQLTSMIEKDEVA